MCNFFRVVSSLLPATRLALLVIAISSTAFAGHQPPPGEECPQPRFTGEAPEPFYSAINPLEASSANRRAGQELYEDISNPACAACHGDDGEGDGQLAGQFDPRPRNFACSATIDGVSDGQLFWIIQNGSPGTAMPPFNYFTDEEIWQLVLYLRSISGH